MDEGDHGQSKFVFRVSFQDDAAAHVAVPVVTRVRTGTAACEQL